MTAELVALIFSPTGAVCMLLLMLALLYYFRQKHQQRIIKRWKKSLDLQQHALAFQRLYQEIEGFKLSRQARQKQDALDYIYGEIEFLPFIALLSLVKPNQETNFYDLGSGTGKAVLACAMVYPVNKSVGIELLPELHLCACAQNKRLAAMQPYLNKSAAIDFILGDFLEQSLEDATLIFINSSTLFGLTWENLCAIINKLTRLTTVITTSKPLISNSFLPVISTKIQMSWGIVPAYIHARKTNFH